MRPSRAASALVLIGALLAACRTAPPEAPPVGVDASWLGGGVDWVRLTQVYVEPVDVSRVTETPWFRQAERSGDVSRVEARSLAGFAQERLRAAFDAEGFGLAAAPGPDTLVVELAVADLLPAHDWLATLASSAPDAATRGRIVVDSRWRAGEGGAVIATFSAASPGPALVVSSADFSWWGHARGPLDAWARELARLARARAGGVQGRSALPAPSGPRSGGLPRG